jgi:uncharacterized membrane protein (DUF106 family)
MDQTKILVLILMQSEGALVNTAASDSSDRSKGKMDQKTLRRLAQNREAARKSRLRKKAYVQQLENSRLKLTQLEQELQRARQQVQICFLFLLIFILLFCIPNGKFLVSRASSFQAQETRPILLVEMVLWRLMLNIHGGWKKRTSK